MLIFYWKEYKVTRFIYLELFCILSHKSVTQTILDLPKYATTSSPQKTLNLYSQTVASSVTVTLRWCKSFVINCVIVVLVTLLLDFVRSSISLCVVFVHPNRRRKQQKKCRHADKYEFNLIIVWALNHVTVIKTKLATLDNRKWIWSG